MWTLAANSGLDLNSPYAYVLWGEYHRDSSVVAVGPDERVIGFVTGFRVPVAPDTVFVWQVAVAGDHRRRGLAGLMLDEVAARPGVTYVEATVTPSNDASAALFRSLGARHGTTVDESPLFGEELFPQQHEAEVRFRIGPIGD